MIIRDMGRCLGRFASLSSLGLLMSSSGFFSSLGRCADEDVY